MNDVQAVLQTIFHAKAETPTYDIQRHPECAYYHYV